MVEKLGALESQSVGAEAMENSDFLEDLDCVVLDEYPGAELPNLGGAFVYERSALLRQHRCRAQPGDAPARISACPCIQNVDPGVHAC
jgi:hypothetical protein